MKKVLLLLANGFEAFEGAAFADVFGWADTYGLERIEIVSASFHPQIRCTFGFAVIPDVVLSSGFDVQEFDALAIPGGFEQAGFYKDAFSERFLQVIGQFNEAGKPIASICVAALPVAKSGVIVGQPATTYHLMGGRRRKQLSEFGVKVVDEAVVEANNVITSTSPATAIEVALRLLEILTSAENAGKVRELMGFSNN